MPSIRSTLNHLDERVMMLEKLLAIAIQEEQEKKQVLFKESRAIKNQLDRLKHKRNALRRAVDKAPNIRQTAMINLAQKRNELVEETKTLQLLKEELTNLFMGQTQVDALSQSKSRALHIKAQVKEITSQETRVRNKQRAYENALVRWVEATKKNPDALTQDEKLLELQVNSDILEFEQKRLANPNFTLDQVQPLTEEVKPVSIGDDNGDLIIKISATSLNEYVPPKEHPAYKKLMGTTEKAENNATLDLLAGPMLHDSADEGAPGTTEK